MQAMGLTLSDLYPDGPLGDHYRSISLKNKDKSYYETVLKIAAYDREVGKKLSKEDRAIERDAFLQLRKIESQSPIW